MLHKTASMFVWRVLDEIGFIFGTPLHSPNGVGAEYMLDEISLQSHDPFPIDAAGLYGPFRGPIPQNLYFTSTIVVLRDPRDILISMYYSWTFSHSIDKSRPTLVSHQGKLFNPTARMREKWKIDGPDAFVLQYAPFVEKTLRTYIDDYIPRPNTTLLFYERLIEDPMKWVSDFVVALGVPRETMAPVVDYLFNEFRPEFTAPVEDPNAHRRQMLPGDAERKLTADTLTALDERFGFYFEFVDAEKRRNAGTCSGISP
jgi:hypothetical protein